MNNSLVMVTLLSVVEIYADFHLKFYAHSDSLSHLGQGLLGYVGVVYLLIQSLRLENVLYVNALWDGMSGLVESLAAYIFLGDRLHSGQQYAGVLFIIAGVVLLHMGKK